MSTLAKTYEYPTLGYVKGKGEHPYTENFIVGLEVEVENARARHPGNVGDYWRTHPDGSLRNNGIEFICSPVQGAAIQSVVDVMWNNMPEQWSFSQRTSIHVHVNARDLEWAQLKMWLLSYCVFEKVLFDFAGMDRDRGIFCVPLLDTNYPDYLISRIVNGTHSTVSSWEKYSAVNLSRLGDLGTVEFRHLPGTKEKPKVNLWLRMLSDIRAFATTTTEEEFLKLLEMRNAHLLINRVFCQSVRDVFATKEITALCRAGVDIVFSALMGEKTRALYLSNLSLESPFNEWVLKGRK